LLTEEADSSYEAAMQVWKEQTIEAFENGGGEYGSDEKSFL
jgi:hypothetical protein